MRANAEGRATSGARVGSASSRSSSPASESCSAARGLERPGTTPALIGSEAVAPKTAIAAAETPRSAAFCLASETNLTQCLSHSPSRTTRSRWSASRTSDTARLDPSLPRRHRAYSRSVSFASMPSASRPRWTKREKSSRSIGIVVEFVDPAPPSSSLPPNPPHHGAREMLTHRRRIAPSLRRARAARISRARSARRRISRSARSRARRASAASSSSSVSRRSNAASAVGFGAGRPPPSGSSPSFGLAASALRRSRVSAARRSSSSRASATTASRTRSGNASSSSRVSAPACARRRWNEAAAPPTAPRVPNIPPRRRAGSSSAAASAAPVSLEASPANHPPARRAGARGGRRTPGRPSACGSPRSRASNPRVACGPEDAYRS